MLVIGLAGLVGLGAVGVELVDHQVLPGKSLLDRLDGTCSVPPTRLVDSTVGPTYSGRFFSAARRRVVGYTIGYPPGHGPGDRLPLVVMLHGYGGNHTDALAGLQPAQAVALRVDGTPLTPMALVTVDGGGGYWNPHPTDDPMAMVMDELVPRMEAMGLGSPPQRVGTMGISMGGYGALLLAEKYPERIAAVAAISPAIWTSYAEARAANPGAYASAADFATDDAVTHARALTGIAVWVASGDADPFHPGVVALGEALPAGAAVHFSGGCHDGAFFVAQEPGALAFLSRHLT
ncbi:MAG TPA: alpha/beta fold hydrolase [Acidimicrobiales bacterium]|nr:alpha/beta fold hydrolase [Acidimicrobiales bacterium]